jgi:hypothetical protein
MRLMRTGAENRHVGETRLNRESSRSHSVFTCVLERQSKSQATGITNVLFSRLNLIDLAGGLVAFCRLFCASAGCSCTNSVHASPHGKCYALGLPGAIRCKPFMRRACSWRQSVLCMLRHLLLVLLLLCPVNNRQ